MHDTELVAGLREGREGAVEHFLQRYQPLFHHCIAQFESDAVGREDLFQDLSWHVLDRLDRNSFDPQKGSLGTWVYRVAWCRCVDLKRKENARRSLNGLSVDEEPPERPDLDSDPGRAAGEAEISALVREALGTLPVDQRRLLEMRYLEGLTLAEIGQLEGLSLEQTKYRMKRASARLRGELTKHLVPSEALD